MDYLIRTSRWDLVVPESLRHRTRPSRIDKYINEYNLIQVKTIVKQYQSIACLGVKSIRDQIVIDANINDDVINVIYDQLPMVEKYKRRDWYIKITYIPNDNFIELHSKTIIFILENCREDDFIFYINQRLKSLVYYYNIPIEIIFEPDYKHPFINYDFRLRYDHNIKKFIEINMTNIDENMEVLKMLHYSPYGGYS